MIKAVAASVVIVAAALPLAVASTAGAAGPTITSIAQTAGLVNLNTGIGQGASAVPVTITGTNFLAAVGTGTLVLSTTAAGVTFAGATWVSGTSVTDAISVAATTPVGFYPLTILDNGLTYTLANAFAVTPAPTVSSVAPTSMPQVVSNLPVTITGTGFEVTSASQVVFTDAGGSPTNITFNLVGTPTATTINGTLSSTAAVGGVASLTITNTDNGTVTDASAITVNSPVPATISPNTISDPTSPNSYTQAFTITGTGFVAGAVVTGSIGAIVFGAATVAAGGTSLTVSATISHGVAGLEDITVTNPDGSTGTATGILGFGQLPPAPTVSSTTTTITVLNGGTVNSETLTGSFGETFGAGGSVTFTGTNITGTVTPLTATTAKMTLTVPAFAANAALTAATTTTSHTTIAIGAGDTALNTLINVEAQTPTLTIVDGASTEQVVASAYNNATGVVTIGASTVAHAIGTVVEIPQVLAITQFSVVGKTGETAITDAQVILVTPAASNWTGGTATGTPAVGLTTATTLTFPGFGFTSGCTATNISSTVPGLTGTVTATSGSVGTLNVTVPATELGATTLDILDGTTLAGNTWIHVTSKTGITAGEVLTIASDPATTDTEQVTVAATFVPGESTLGNGFLVPITTGLHFAHTTAAAITGSGITAATGTGLVVTMLVTCGANSALVTLTTAANAVTAPAVSAPISVGQGATAFSVTFTGWSGLNTTPADFAVTSSNTSVTFGAPTASTATTITVPVTVAAGATVTATVPVTVTYVAGGVGSGTDPAGLAIVASPTVTAVGGTTTVTNGSTVTETVTGTGFVNGATVAYANAGTVDAAIPTAVTFNSATSLTVVIGPVGAGAVGGSDSIVVTNPNGGVGTLANALTVVAPVITGAAATSGGSLSSAGFTGTVTLTGTGFTSGTLTTTVSGATVAGGAGTTTFVSPTSATFVITANTNAGGATPTITLTDNGQTATFQFTVSANPTVSAIAPTSGAATITKGSASVPVTITGTGFLPGAVVTFTDPAVTGVVTSITPFNIFLNVTVGATAGAASTVKVTNTTGGTVTSAAVLSFSAAPTITSATSLLGGKAATMTITGTGFVTGAVVSAGTPGLATFGTATVVSSTVITVPVTPVSFSGTVALSSSLTVTNPVGAGSATLAGGLVINPGPGVTGTYFVPTFSKNLVVPINGSGFEPGLTATSANADYTVIVGNVSATQVSLLVTTDSQATSGTSSLITFTNPDGGKVTFTLNGGPAVTPPPPVVLKITGFSGRIVTGTTSIFKIKGTGFTGQPRITSNAVGTKATVSGDTGKVLTVRVTVRAGTPRGVHTFTITFKSGKVLKLKYSQH